MKKAIPLLTLVYGAFLLSGSLYGLGEKTLLIGAAQGWGAVETLDGVVLLNEARPYPALALSSSRDDPASGIPLDRGTVDMALSFDEGRPELFTDKTGRYAVSVNPSVAAVGGRWARGGAGAAYFSGVQEPQAGSTLGIRAPGRTIREDSIGASLSGSVRSRDSSPLVIVPRDGRGGLFFTNNRFGDFSLEFWVYPANLESGEQILSWTSSRKTAMGADMVARIQCVAAKNRLQWYFENFFAAPDDSQHVNITLEGATPITPRTWSHHLVRYDSREGLLEYLVNGKTESLIHTTASGGEAGEVYAPVSGEGSRMVLGGRFSGVLDEFRIHSVAAEPRLEQFPPRGGKMVTRLLDLGEGNSQIVRIDVKGGGGSRGGPAWSSLLPGGSFSFEDDSAIQFFIRAGDSPFIRVDGEWKVFTPGEELGLRGRYVQIAAELYPSGDGEASPYLEDFRLTYIPDEPPSPPALVTAIARDGAVELVWRSSSDRDTAGYLVYYGLSRGDFFGEGAILGVSPIDVGKRTAVRIDGLTNGVLYYFAIAAYDRVNHGGEFSREVSARPLRNIE